MPKKKPWDVVVPLCPVSPFGRKPLSPPPHPAQRMRFKGKQVLCILTYYKYFSPTYSYIHIAGNCTSFPPTVQQARRGRKGKRDLFGCRNADGDWWLDQCFPQLDTVDRVLPTFKHHFSFSLLMMRASTKQNKQILPQKGPGYVRTYVHSFILLRKGLKSTRFCSHDKWSNVKAEPHSRRRLPFHARAFSPTFRSHLQYYLLFPWARSGPSCQLLDDFWYYCKTSWQKRPIQVLFRLKGGGEVLSPALTSGSWFINISIYCTVGVVNYWERVE